jgi:hypothetical protein
MNANTDRPIDTTELKNLRMEQLAVAMGALARDLEVLGLQFAAVVHDPHIQSEDTDRLVYAGNVGTETGALLLRSYVKMAENPKSQVKKYEQTTSTSFVQPLPN